MIRPKNVQKQEKHDLVICPPILKNFQNVKIDKSISALQNANFIKIFSTPLEGVLMIPF